MSLGTKSPATDFCASGGVVIADDLDNPGYVLISLNGYRNGSNPLAMSFSLDPTGADPTLYITNKGPIQFATLAAGSIVLPRMTTAQRLALTNASAPFGTIVYDQTLQKAFLQVNPAGPTWQQITSV